MLGTNSVTGQQASASQCISSTVYYLTKQPIVSDNSGTRMTMSMHSILSCIIACCCGPMTQMMCLLFRYISVKYTLVIIESSPCMMHAYSSVTFWLCMQDHDASDIGNRAYAASASEHAKCTIFKVCCCRPPQWADQMQVKHKQPFYSVLPDEHDCMRLFQGGRTSKYVAQVRALAVLHLLWLHPADNACLFDKLGDPTVPPGQDHKLLLSEHAHQPSPKHHAVLA